MEKNALSEEAAKNYSSAWEILNRQDPTVGRFALKSNETTKPNTSYAIPLFKLAEWQPTKLCKLATNRSAKNLNHRNASLLETE